MNNFTTSSIPADGQTPIPKHLETLTTSVFQSLFPAISPQRTPLSSIRRVLLLNRETDTAHSDSIYTISFRHYAITSKPLVSMSRGLKRLRTAEKLATSRTQKKLRPAGAKGGRSTGTLPNMARLDDVADYILNPADAGFTSASETEADTDAEVEVLETSARRVFDKRDKQRRSKQAEEVSGAEAPRPRQRQAAAPQKRAIKLTELGPRMKLRLVKVEEGVCAGKVMWHEFVQKTSVEEKQMDSVWEARRAEKEERRKLQKDNVAKKRAAAKGKGRAAAEEGQAEDEDAEMYDDDEWDEYEGEDGGAEEENGA